MIVHRETAVPILAKSIPATAKWIKMHYTTNRACDANTCLVSVGLDETSCWEHV
jgi:hypothetical protein